MDKYEPKEWVQLTGINKSKFEDDQFRLDDDAAAAFLRDLRNRDRSIHVVTRAQAVQ